MACSCVQSKMHGIDLTLRVLTTGFWPTPAVTCKCNLPREALDAFSVFQRLVGL
jgi:cullin 3